jgi:hypothetical protein
MAMSKSRQMGIVTDHFAVHHELMEDGPMIAGRCCQRSEGRVQGRDRIRQGA